MKTINKFLIASIILSLAFGQLLRFHFVSFLPPFYLHDLLLIIFLTINLPILIHLPLTTFYKETFLFLISLLIFNPNQLLTFRIIVYFLSFLLLLRLKLDLNFFIKINQLAFALVALLGLWQFFFLPDLRILASLGWDDHLNRLTFPYLDPNFTGIVLALGFFSFQDQSTWLSFLFLIPLALTYSRSAWISWFLTLIISSKRYLRLGLVFIILSLIFLPRRFGEGNNLFRTYSIKSRLNNDALIFRRLLNNPLKGEFISKYHLIYSFNRAETANNSFLFVWQIGGLVTLLTFMKLLFTILKRLTKPQLWILVIVASFFNNVFFYPFILIWLLWITAFQLKASSSTSALS